MSGQWTLAIEDKAHHVVATLVVAFTNDRASSCMSGDWKRVSVTSKTTKDPNFYPISDPLSFTLKDNRLTIGRNEVCDAYIWLEGNIKDESARGEYFSLGLGGSSPLGFFTLTKRK